MDDIRHKSFEWTTVEDEVEKCFYFFWRTALLCSKQCSREFSYHRSSVLCNVAYAILLGMVNWQDMGQQTAVLQHCCVTPALHFLSTSHQWKRFLLHLLLHVVTDAGFEEFQLTAHHHFPSVVWTGWIDKSGPPNDVFVWMLSLFFQPKTNNKQKETGEWEWDCSSLSNTGLIRWMILGKGAKYCCSH